MRFHWSIKHKSYTTRILIGQTWQPRSTCMEKMKLFVTVPWEMEHDTQGQGSFLHFECIKGPKVVFRKYVRALTYQTLGDIIENLIPEGECVASLVSVNLMLEWRELAWTHLTFNKRAKIVLRGDRPTPAQASKPSVFDVLMEESNRSTSFPARRFPLSWLTNVFSNWPTIKLHSSCFVLS